MANLHIKERLPQSTKPNSNTALLYPGAISSSCILEPSYDDCRTPALAEKTV